MPTLEIDRVRTAIARGKARWEVGETTMTDYTLPDGATAMFGLALDPERALRDAQSARESEPRLAMLMAPPPPKLDWRNHGGHDYAGPVHNQGSCGSCVAFATCAVLESRAMIAAGRPGIGFDLSEAHLFACGAGSACSRGWIYEDALDFARRTGVGLERDFPYAPLDQACRQVAPAVKVPRYGRAQSRAARKLALTRGPVVGGMQVFEDFMGYRQGIYRHVSGDFLGWHAVSVVGYDDDEGCWIAKNSWGSGWGEGGFFRIEYGDCGIDSQVLFYDPEISILTADALTS